MQHLLIIILSILYFTYTRSFLSEGCSLALNQTSHTSNLIHTHTNLHTTNTMASAGVTTRAKSKAQDKAIAQPQPPVQPALQVAPVPDLATIQTLSEERSTLQQPQEADNEIPPTHVKDTGNLWVKWAKDNVIVEATPPPSPVKTENQARNNIQNLLNRYASRRDGIPHVKKIRFEEPPLVEDELLRPATKPRKRTPYIPRISGPPLNKKGGKGKKGKKRAPPKTPATPCAKKPAATAATPSTSQSSSGQSAEDLTPSRSSARIAAKRGAAAVIDETDPIDQTPTKKPKLAAKRGAAAVIDETDPIDKTSTKKPKLAASPASKNTVTEAIDEIEQTQPRLPKLKLKKTPKLAASPASEATVTDAINETKQSPPKIPKLILKNTPKKPSETMSTQEFDQATNTPTKKGKTSGLFVTKPSAKKRAVVEMSDKESEVEPRVIKKAKLTAAPAPKASPTKIQKHTGRFGQIKLGLKPARKIETASPAPSSIATKDANVNDNYRAVDVEDAVDSVEEDTGAGNNKKKKSTVFVGKPTMMGTSSDKPPGASLDEPWRCANRNCNSGQTWHPRDGANSYGRKVISNVSSPPQSHLCESH